MTAEKVAGPSGGGGIENTKRKKGETDTDESNEGMKGLANNSPCPGATAYVLPGNGTQEAAR